MSSVLLLVGLALTPRPPVNKRDAENLIDDREIGPKVSVSNTVSNDGKCWKHSNYDGEIGCGSPRVGQVSFAQKVSMPGLPSGQFMLSASAAFTN